MKPLRGAAGGGGAGHGGQALLAALPAAQACPRSQRRRRRSRPSPSNIKRELGNGCEDPADDVLGLAQQRLGRHRRLEVSQRLGRVGGGGVGPAGRRARDRGRQSAGLARRRAALFVGCMHACAMGGRGGQRGAAAAAAAGARLPPRTADGPLARCPLTHSRRMASCRQRRRAAARSPQAAPPRAGRRLPGSRSAWSGVGRSCLALWMCWPGRIPALSEYART